MGADLRRTKSGNTRQRWPWYITTPAAAAAARNVMKYITTILIWVSLLVNESHTLFEKSGNVNFHGVVMPLQWAVWFISNSVWGIIMGAAILLYQKNRTNEASVKAYIIFCTIDLIMLLVNYKQSGYEAIYTALLISWLLIYNYGTKDRQGDIVTR